ncbi:MAG: MspI family type II restriction endonuclease [Lachnospiraceae bacterium]|nr:MspI family type II restriction endonuclease [Lachnospiraceae bacterium]
MEDNTKKSLHGSKGIETLDNMVNSLQEMKYIKIIKKNYSIADPDFGEAQFKFQYLIEFRDKEQWILQHTTSIRDRINCQQWHSENIKRLNPGVKKAYVVVPDGLAKAELHKVSNYQDKIARRSIYSAIDGVFPLGEAYSMIEKKAMSLLPDGAAHAKLGLSFEAKIACILNDKQNFEKWKCNDETSTGYFYQLYLDIVKLLGLEKEKVIALKAVSDIPKLPSGGSPKTDVLLSVETIQGTKNYTFSCKRSNSSWISVHEYTADAFARVLNPCDMHLKELLYEFQQAGGAGAMGVQKAEEFGNCIKKYSDILSRWVIGGVGGEGDRDTQWAEYIIIFNENSNSYSIHTVEGYIEECKRQGVKGQFGTLFKWTYPSKGRGRRIQLKGKIL